MAQTLVWVQSFSPRIATVVKTENGTLPEGKVKIKLEHDGTVLDVDEDDIEKVKYKTLSLSFWDTIINM